MKRMKDKLKEKKFCLIITLLQIFYSSRFSDSTRCYGKLRIISAPSTLFLLITLNRSMVSTNLVNSYLIFRISFPSYWWLWAPLDNQHLTALPQCAAKEKLKEVVEMESSKKRQVGSKFARVTKGKETQSAKESDHWSKSVVYEKWHSYLGKLTAD